MIELISNPQAWIAFATLTALELVLGIDNIIFISILVDKLPPEKREFARKIGLSMAMQIMNVNHPAPDASVDHHQHGSAHGTFLLSRSLRSSMKQNASAYSLVSALGETGRVG